MPTNGDLCQPAPTIGAGAIEATGVQASAAYVLFPVSDHFFDGLTSCNSMDRNARASPLLRLPAELRNRVYEYVLYKGTYWFNRERATTSKRPIEIVPRIANRLSLLRVCRQTYAETALLPFSLNTFCVRARTVHDCLPILLKPVQRHAITKLRLPFIVLKRERDVQLCKYVLHILFEVYGESLAFHDQLKGLQKIIASIAVDAGYVSRFSISIEALGKTRDTLRQWLEKGNNKDVEILLQDEGMMDLSHYGTA